MAMHVATQRPQSEDWFGRAVNHGTGLAVSLGRLASGLLRLQGSEFILVNLKVCFNVSFSQLSVKALPFEGTVLT